jgi:two-component system response regulator RegA
VLLLDADRLFRERLARALRRQGIGTTSASSVPEAISAARDHFHAFALVDPGSERPSTSDPIAAILAVSPNTKLAVLTAYGNIGLAVGALRRGAFHYVTKPIEPEEVLSLLARMEASTGATMDGPLPRTSLPARATPSLARAKWEHVQRVLGDSKGNLSESARRLAVTRRTLQLMLKRAATSPSW